MDYVLSRPIYSYPSTINLMYYYTKVLLLWNYFYYQKLEMLWKKVGTNVSLSKWISTTLGHEMSLPGCEDGTGVHLTKGQPAQSSTNLGHKMSLPGMELGGWVQEQGWGYIWPKISLHEVVPNLAMRGLYRGVHLAKGQPACNCTTLGQAVSVLGGVCLTKGQPDLK